MRTRPPEIDDRHLLDALAERWHFHAASIHYLAEGAGSHHWIGVDPAGDRRFVTVDEIGKNWMGTSPDEAAQRLSEAFGTAAALKSAGLEFVVAPLADRDGMLLHRILPNFTIALFPYIEASVATVNA